MKWYNHIVFRYIVCATSDILMGLMAIPLILLPIVGWLALAWLAFMPRMDAEDEYGLNYDNEHRYYDIVPIQHDIKHLIVRVLVFLAMVFAMLSESLKRTI